jgi:CBS domain-containing protein
MTREPVYCEPNDSVSLAAELMRKHDVGSLPVVESAESRTLVGIVTDRDVVVKIVAGTRAAATATVRDAMTAKPWSCREDEDVRQAVAAMADHRVRRMPVVDADGRLVGIIAQADVATRVQRDQQTGGAGRGDFGAGA